MRPGNVLGCVAVVAGQAVLLDVGDALCNPRPTIGEIARPLRHGRAVEVQDHEERTTGDEEGQQGQQTRSLILVCRQSEADEEDDNRDHAHQESEVRRAHDLHLELLRHEITDGADHERRKQDLEEDLEDDWKEKKPARAG